MDAEEIDQSIEYFVVYSMLVNAARHHGLATYQEIAQAVALPISGSQMGLKPGKLLRTISGNEKKQGRPMLSCIAVSVNNKPSSNFYKWARNLGFLREGEDEETFWHNECKKVYDVWKIKYWRSKT